MARFASLMHASTGPDHAALLRERMLFAQIFNGHLAREQEEVDQLQRIDPGAAAKRDARGAMIGRLRRDYSDHVGRWTPPKIRSDFAIYSTEVLALQKRLTEFMAWEEENLPIYA